MTDQLDQIADLDANALMTQLGLTNSRTGAAVQDRALDGVEFVGKLESNDLLAFGRALGSKPSPLKRLRASHHHLARTLAKGSRPSEASAITGFSPSRISILQQDSMFQEILAMYQEQVDTVATETLERMKHLSLDALEELRDRLELEPEKFRNDELLKLATSMLDRTGHGPMAKQEHLVTTLDANDLIEMKKVLDASQQGRVIDAQSYHHVEDCEEVGPQSLSAVRPEGEEQ